MARGALWGSGKCQNLMVLIIPAPRAPHPMIVAESAVLEAALGWGMLLLTPSVNVSSIADRDYLNPRHTETNGLLGSRYIDSAAVYILHMYISICMYIHIYIYIYRIYVW